MTIKPSEIVRPTNKQVQYKTIKSESGAPRLVFTQSLSRTLSTSTPPSSSSSSSSTSKSNINSTTLPIPLSQIKSEKNNIVSSPSVPAVLFSPAPAPAPAAPENPIVAEQPHQPMMLSEIERQLLELKKQTDELRKQLELSQKQNDEYKIRLEKLEQEKQIEKDERAVAAATATTTNDKRYRNVMY